MQSKMAHAKKELSLKMLSIIVSWVLDLLGFSEEHIQERIDAMNSYSAALSIATKRMLGRHDVERILAGSLREGVGLLYLNDRDILQIDHAVICGTDCHGLTNRGKLAFEMEQRDAPSGYCFLKLLEETVNPSNAFLRYQNALVQEFGGRFLSSSIFVTNVDEISLEKGTFSYNDRLRKRYGPSLRRHRNMNSLISSLLNWSDFNILGDETDFVRGFPCEADCFLQQWKNRHRPSGWPYRKTIAHVMCLPGYVVPVGQKGTKHDDLQWRICFTDAELYLVQALNITQKKTYILLKLIVKHNLQSLSKDITSYIVKMVILWISEKIPQKQFSKKYLVARLLDALVYLRQCVRDKNLPNYMLPTRNMFAGKLKRDEQTKILKELDFLIGNGPKFIQEVFEENCTIRKDGLEHLCSILMASSLHKLLALNIALYSTDKLADTIVLILECQTYWQRATITIPQFFKFLGAYGNRPISWPNDGMLHSHLKRLEKNLQSRKQAKGRSYTKYPKYTYIRECDNGISKSDCTWIFQFRFQLTLLFTTEIFLLCVLLGQGHKMHIFIFVIYLWFLDDRPRERICLILYIIHAAILMKSVYEHMMKYGSLLEPMTLYKNKWSNITFYQPSTPKVFVQLTIDMSVLLINSIHFESITYEY